MSGQAGTPQGASPKRGDWRTYTKLGVIGVVVVLAIVFVFQNTQKVPIHFLWLEFRAQMWIVLLVMLVVGLVVGLFAGWRRQRRRRKQYR
jgi:uncharacterized integral membrane protein